MRLLRLNLALMFIVAPAFLTAAPPSQPITAPNGQISSNDIGYRFGSIEAKIDEHSKVLASISKDLAEVKAGQEKMNLELASIGSKVGMIVWLGLAALGVLGSLTAYVFKEWWEARSPKAAPVQPAKQPNNTSEAIWQSVGQSFPTAEAEEFISAVMRRMTREEEQRRAEKMQALEQRLRQVERVTHTGGEQPDPGA